jgi:hypothetical protein
MTFDDSNLPIPTWLFVPCVLTVTAEDAVEVGWRLNKLKIESLAAVWGEDWPPKLLHLQCKKSNFDSIDDLEERDIGNQEHWDCIFLAKRAARVTWMLAWKAGGKMSTAKYLNAGGGGTKLPLESSSILHYKQLYGQKSLQI